MIRTYLRRYAIPQNQQTDLGAGNRRYVHRLNGGLSDNLGLRARPDRLAIADDRAEVRTRKAIAFAVSKSANRYSV